MDRDYFYIVKTCIYLINHLKAGILMSFISNINTYISYTCVPLTETNYNEVDALIFARLSYFPFERIFMNYKK